MTVILDSELLAIKIRVETRFFTSNRINYECCQIVLSTIIGLRCLLL